METGKWGSNKQLAWYPLTVEGKVAMGVAKRECRKKKGKNLERMEWKVMESAGKKFHPEMLTQPSIKNQYRPPKTLSDESLYPLPKVVGIIGAFIKIRLSAYAAGCFRFPPFPMFQTSFH